MNVYLPYTAILPSEYQEVEYIQSSGTQWIDTGFKPSNKTKVITKGYILDSRMYGVGRAGSYYSIALYSNGTNYRGRCRSSSSGNSTVDSSVAINTTSHIFECSQIDGLYIDGTRYGTFTQYTYTESYNMYLFAWNNYRDNIADGKANGRMYYCKIYENGTLVRDFVPCYRKSDSVIGLYDLVNSVFYTNAGTGTFSKGNDVTMAVLKNAYIGEVWTPGSNTLAYWKFKSDIYDYSGNGNNWDSGSGTYSDNMLVIGENTPLKASNSIITDASNFTFITWLDCSSTYNGSTCINSNSSYSAIIAFWNRTNNLEFGVNTGTWYTIVGTYSSGVHNFVGVRNGNTIYFYIDGELQGNKAISGTIGNGTRIFKGNSTPLKIGETIVEKGAWTQAEIQHYFDITKSTYGL